MTTPVHAGIATDFSMGLLSHFWLPPGAPAASPMPSFELFVPMDWDPGKALNKHKLTSTVFFNDQKIVLDGHDQGPWICDVTYPPVNLWYPVMWPFSSRKNCFSAAMIIADKTAVASVDSGALMFMMTCGEPLSAPTAITPSCSKNNLIFGMLPSDVAFGWIGAASSVIVTAIINRAFPPSPTNRLMFEIAGKLASVSGINQENMIKLGLGAAVDGLLSYARGRVNGTGDWSVKVPIGSVYFGSELSHTRSSNDPSKNGGALQISRGTRQSTFQFDSRQWSEQEASEEVPAAPAAPPPPPALNARTSSAPGGAR